MAHRPFRGWLCPLPPPTFFQEPNMNREKEIKELKTENKKLRELLQDALPHIECKNNSQSGLITEIGEFLEQAQKGG